MNKIKILLIIFCFFSFFEISAQPVMKSESIKFQSSYLPLSLKKKPQLVYNSDIPNLLETDRGRTYRGKALEPIARDIYKHNFGIGYQYVDASYNKGVNGLDGLLVKKNTRGSITKVHVVEIKSGTASLKANILAPQLSKEWILSGIDKSLAEKVTSLEQLQYNIKYNNLSSSQVKQEKAEFSKINKERRLLSKTREMIDNDLFRRFQVNIKYNDGKLLVEQWEVLEETYKDIPINKRNSENIFKWSEKKTLANFSYLDKDNYKLSPFEKKVKKSMFDEFEKVLRKQGYSEVDINSYLKRLRTDKNLNPSNIAGLADDIDHITKTSFERASKNYNIKNSIGLTCLALFQKGKVIYDYCNGSIGKTDLIFNSVTNSADLLSVFIKRLNPYMTSVFVVTDVIKNIYSYGKGSISFSNAIINSASNIAGVIVGGLAAKAVALGAAKIGGTVGSFVSSPVGGLIVAGITFGVTYFITSNIVRWTGNIIINKYEAIKTPERFNSICNQIRTFYAL